MESIVVELIGTKLPFLSLNDPSGPVDVDKLLKVLPINSDPFPDASSDDRTLTRLERLKEELCAVVIMPAQSEESGRRSATIVSASVPASGKSFTVTYSRTAKIASQVSGDSFEGVRSHLQGITIVQPLMIMRICMEVKFFQPILLRVMTVQKSFQVNIKEKNQIEMVSVAKVPVVIHCWL
jgi:hypothetical protein